MKRNIHKIIIAVMALAFLIVGALVSVSIINSKTVAVKRAEKSLSYMSETYAGKFDTIFSDSELIVNNFAITIEKEYTVEDYINDRVLFERMKASTSGNIKKIVGNMNYPAGLYITFAPEASNGRDEIWYLKSRSGEIKYIDSSNLSESWLEKKETTEYYYRTIEEGSLWLEASYDPGMDGDVVSYTRLLNDRNGEIIGVIGIDILVDDIFDMLEVIDDEIQGFSSFSDKYEGIVAGRDTEKYRNSQDHIYSEADIGERWKITLVQPVNVAVESIIKTEAAVILLGILIMIAVVIIIFYFSRKRVEPIIHEFEAKEAVLINQARQAKMGEMIGNIAHQWKQPLNSMKMALSNMQEDYDNDFLERRDFESYIYRMKLMVDDLAETADDFITFLKPGKKKEIFSANREINRVSDLMRERIRRSGVALTISGQEVFVEGYRNEFGQCLFNLFDNAVDAMKNEKSGNRRIVVRTSHEITESGTENNIVSVFNNGSNIGEENRERIFDIYFTTKEETDGTGIGLYLTREIIRSHFNGDVYFENVPGGVTFNICVPAAEVKRENQ